MTSKSVTRWAGAFGISLGLALAAQAAEPQQPTIESLDGEGALLKSADGTAREAKVGDAAGSGDTIEVKPGSALRMAFEGGAQAVLGAGAEVAVFQDENGETTPEGESPKVSGIEIRKGVARLVVTPPSKTQAKPPVRFWVRSRATTMGVRGTDFVVRVKEGETTVHTLEGRVEVGRTAVAIRLNDGVFVPSDTFHHAEEGKAFDKNPQRFSATQFLKTLKQEEPKLEKLYQLAAAPGEAERLRKKFESQLASAPPAAPAEEDEAPAAGPSGSPSAAPSALPSSAPSVAPLSEGVDAVEFSGVKAAGKAGAKPAVAKPHKK